MNIVTIKEVKGLVACADDGTAEHVFNVRNTTDKALRVDMHLSVDGPAREGWLQIEGETEQELGAATMTQVSVKIRVPKGSAPGKYSYRLRVFDPDMPGENFTDGDPVYFEVPAGEEKPEPQDAKGKKPFKWWIPVAIAAGVIAAGVVVWLLWPSGSEVAVFDRSLFGRAVFK